MIAMNTHFSDLFGIDPRILKRHGAFDVSLITDLPLFVDPFLLFNSSKPTYEQLHEQIIEYLLFLRDRAAEEELDPGLIDAWYRFKEVRQNWMDSPCGLSGP